MDFSARADRTPDFPTIETPGRGIIARITEMRRDEWNIFRATHPKHLHMAGSIADAYRDTFPRERSLADFLDIAMDRIRKDPDGELTLTVGHIREMAMIGLAAGDLSALAKARLEALRSPASRLSRSPSRP